MTNLWQISSAIFSAITMLISGVVYFTVKFNDIKHIQTAVERQEKATKELVDKVLIDHEKTQEEIKELSLLVREITVRCQERHRIKKVR
jgi:hypothetical protein